MKDLTSDAVRTLLVRRHGHVIDGRDECALKCTQTGNLVLSFRQNTSSNFSPPMELTYSHRRLEEAQKDRPSQASITIHTAQQRSSKDGVLMLTRSDS